MSLAPTAGPSYSNAAIYGAGFFLNSLVTIKFGTIQIATEKARAPYGKIGAPFMVPSVSPGTYNVTATDAEGNSASATFTVTSRFPGGASPEETSTASYPPTTSKPTTSPTAKSEGFWSPLTIGAFVAAGAGLTVFAFFMWRRRNGAEEMSIEEEPPVYKPQYSPSRTLAVEYRYDQFSYVGQPSKPAATVRPSQPPSYSRPLPRSSMTTPIRQAPSYSKPQPFTKACPHCKRMVRDDYNLCPYCQKRLR